MTINSASSANVPTYSSSTSLQLAQAGPPPPGGGRNNTSTDQRCADNMASLIDRANNALDQGSKEERIGAKMAIELSLNSNSKNAHCRSSAPIETLLNDLEEKINNPSGNR